MLARQINNPLPLQLALGAVNNVSDIAAVKSLSPGHEQLRRQQVFRSKDFALDAGNACRLCTIEPAVVDDDHSIAHAGDQIHEILTTKSFGEPDRVGGLAAKILLFEVLERRRHIFRLEEKIEVLGKPPDSRVFL